MAAVAAAAVLVAAVVGRWQHGPMRFSMRPALPTILQQQEQQQQQQ